MQKPLMLLPFYNKNIFCGAFSASEFSIFAIFMIFLQGGGGGEGVGEEREE